MVIAFQIGFVLLLIIVVILFVFKPRQAASFALPDNYQQLLNDYVLFYVNLEEEGKKRFEDRLESFLAAVKITGANAEVEDLDRILIGAAAVIPVYAIPDWEYVNLREVLVYPGNFNHDYEQHGNNRMVSGMIGTGGLENVMILSKWELRQGFINNNNTQNTAIHEFIHLVDKMDGTLDGVPELLLERKYVGEWKDLLQATMITIRRGDSDINPYGATSPVECFAVVAEYFFEKPDAFRAAHPALHSMLKRIFIRK
jgi:Mlc titration factor MtfA (ptsG expression regulator)